MAVGPVAATRCVFVVLRRVSIVVGEVPVTSVHLLHGRYDPSVLGVCLIAAEAAVQSGTPEEEPNLVYLYRCSRWAPRQ